MKLCLQSTVMSIYQVTVVDTSVRSSLSRLCVPSQRNVVFFLSADIGNSGYHVSSG